VTLFLIGTSHGFQKGMRNVPTDHYREFLDLLRQAVQRHEVKTIAEEMSEDALGNNAVSLPALVAAELAIVHVFCDPNKLERAAAGLPVEDCPATWGKREHEWIERLKCCEFPALFVCGANHVPTFTEGCSSQQIAVQVLQTDWVPVNKIPLESRLI
jgi:hypothetical protein